jgi:peptidoglycan/xylan/chitin deacetylase (PgdA/CDA1 family)
MDTAKRLSKWVMALVLAFVAVLLRSDGYSALAHHFSTGCTSGHEIALTFDDGPNPPYTQQVLDILSAYNARATFFVEGAAAEAHPELVRREMELGMAIGSHSYGHAKDLAQMGPDDFHRDLKRVETVIGPMLCSRLALYRAPYGKTSAVILEELRRAGYVSIGWDIDSRDWDSSTTTEQIVNNVLSKAHPGGIILLHDGGLGEGNPNRTATVEALPLILDGLRERGLEPVTVPEIIALSGAQHETAVTGCLTKQYPSVP